jgi:hypothetical protein
MGEILQIDLEFLRGARDISEATTRPLFARMMAKSIFTIEIKSVL